MQIFWIRKSKKQLQNYRKFCKYWGLSNYFSLLRGIFKQS